MSSCEPAALLVGSDPDFNSRRDQLVALAARYAIPTIYQWRDFTDGRRLDELWDQSDRRLSPIGLYTGRILKGEKPADLPVVQPTKFEFVINLKTAKVLGLAVPNSHAIARRRGYRMKRRELFRSISKPVKNAFLH